MSNTKEEEEEATSLQAQFYKRATEIPLVNNSVKETELEKDLYDPWPDIVQSILTPKS